MIICGRNPLKILPQNATAVRNDKVDNMHPIPKKISCFLLKLFSITWAENTPLQKSIVSGFEPVSRSPWMKILWLLTLENNSTLGRKVKLNISNIAFIPNNINTMPPSILIIDWILPLLIIDATPKPDKVMYSPSIRVIARTRDIPMKKPYVVEVLNTIKHIGPTASCNNIPNLNPL